MSFLKIAGYVLMSFGVILLFVGFDQEPSAVIYGIAALVSSITLLLFAKHFENQDQIIEQLVTLVSAGKRNQRNLDLQTKLLKILIKENHTLPYASMILDDGGFTEDAEDWARSKLEMRSAERRGDQQTD